MSKREQFIEVAKSQVGVRETGNNNVKYNTWYYGREVSGDGYAWCDVFVSWCANETGILNSFVPREAYVPYTVNWYKSRGLYHTKDYTPKEGDLAIFTNESHIGIVEYYDGRTHTIEGNKSNMVKRCEYNTWGSIIGYCEVPFTDELKYRAHVGFVGWMPWVSNGEIAGTTGECKRMEAIQIDAPFEIEAKAHIECIGWVDYGKINKDTIIGTTGEFKRLECLCLKGNFKYRVHIQGTGWSAWTNADGICTQGTVGQELRLEAIQIEIL